MWFLVVGMEKGLIDREKGGASKDVDCCCKGEERAYLSQER